MPAQLRITVDRNELAWLGEQLGAFLTVSSAFRGSQVEHALVLSELSHAELSHAWAAYRFGRRDVDPMLGSLVATEGKVVTHCRHEVVDDSVWYQSRLLREHFEPLRMDHCIQSEVRFSDGLIHRLAFVHCLGDRPFTEPERQRVHAFHCALLLRWHCPDKAHLPPRTKAVLDALLRGVSAKEVSVALELSRASLDREVQTIYHHYGVSSRAELLAAAGTAELDPQKKHEVDALAPRQKQTLALLLTGLSESDIACVMGVSFHTLHEYVKTIFRILKIRSRPELMAKFAGLSTSDIS